MTTWDFARELQRYIHLIQADTAIDLYSAKKVLADVLTMVESELYTIEERLEK